MKWKIQERIDRVLAESNIQEKNRDIAKLTLHFLLFHNPSSFLGFGWGGIDIGGYVAWFGLRRNNRKAQEEVVIDFVGIVIFRYNEREGVIYEAGDERGSYEDLFLK